MNSEPIGAAPNRDIARDEATEKELDRLITRRHDARVSSEGERQAEEMWQESVKHYEEKRRQMARLEWHASSGTPFIAGRQNATAPPQTERRCAMSRGNISSRLAKLEASTHGGPSGRCQQCGLRPPDKGYIVVDGNDPAGHLPEVCPQCGRNTKIHIRVVCGGEEGGA